MPTDRTPSWPQCRAAARAVRSAERGREAIERFRPAPDLRSPRTAFR